MKGPRILALLLASVTLIVLLFLFVLPGRTWLAQRRSLAAAATRVQVLSSENARLAEEASRLQTGAEIERRARSQYGLVKPGEQPYAILPPPQRAPVTTPVPKKGHRHRTGWPSRVWRHAEFWKWSLLP